MPNHPSDLGVGRVISHFPDPKCVHQSKFVVYKHLVGNRVTRGHFPMLFWNNYGTSCIYAICIQLLLCLCDGMLGLKIRQILLLYLPVNKSKYKL